MSRGNHLALICLKDHIREEEKREQQLWPSLECNTGVSRTVLVTSSHSNINKHEIEVFSAGETPVLHSKDGHSQYDHDDKNELKRLLS